MFIEMTCGKCDASFQSDTTDHESLAMVWAQSFINAHHECGYMTKPINQNLEEKMRQLDVIYKEHKEKEL